MLFRSVLAGLHVLGAALIFALAAWAHLSTLGSVPAATSAAVPARPLVTSRG